jgi:solute:Na+ symporter, SSS family
MNSFFANVVTIYALFSQVQETSVHRMVEDADKVALVVAMFPLIAGIYWNRANASVGLIHAPRRKVCLFLAVA